MKQLSFQMGDHAIQTYPVKSAVVFDETGEHQQNWLLIEGEWRLAHMVELRQVLKNRDFLLAYLGPTALHIFGEKTRALAVENINDTLFLNIDKRLVALDTVLCSDIVELVR